MAEEDEGLLSMTTSSANLTVNPFETASLDSMHLPAFSPSVFTSSQETPCSKKKSNFRWSIDQMSLLFPADIDELPQQQDASFLPKEKEEQVQEAINQFFSQKVVVPSPWSESKPMKHVTFSPKPPSVSVLSEHSAENSLCSSNGSFLGSLSGKVDVSCQTAITLPLNFDLEALLGKGRFVYTKTSVESFPVAPLRRKLFTQSESSSNVSPLSAASRESGPFSPSISPIKSSQESSPALEDAQLARTPNSIESQFSSSPIARFRTTPLRPVPHVQYQASPLSGKMESPLMSPIREAPNDIGLPPSPIPHSSENLLETGDHISPVIIKGSSLYKQARPSEHRMDTSLSKGAIQEFRPQMADVGIGGNDKEPVCERVDFLPERVGDGRNERTGKERSDDHAGRVVTVFDTSCGNDARMIETFDASERSVDDGNGSIEGFDESIGEEAIEGRKNFTLGLTRELSPIQKIGDHISMIEEPGCSSRLQGTQEESSMDTSLMSNRGLLRENRHASSPPRESITCNFSLETSTALSPIPKTGNLSQFSPVRTDAEDNTKAEVDTQSSRPKGRNKMVSFHIGTEFSPIRCVESRGGHISGNNMPITSSRVHESNADLLMETSLFSLDGRDEVERDRSEMVENIGADDDGGNIKPLTSSQGYDPWHANSLPQAQVEVFEDGINRESNNDGLIQQFVQTSPKGSMNSERMNQRHLHEPNAECHSVEVADSITQHHPPINNSEMFTRTSSAYDTPASTSKSCGSSGHTGVCWVSDSNPSSVKHDTNPNERWNAVHSPMATEMRLTSTFRYGTPYANPPFGLLSGNAQSASPSVNLSSVSLIANASSTKEDLSGCLEVGRTSSAIGEQIQRFATKDKSFHQVHSQDRVEDCQMQTSFRKSPPCGMTTSRSYDSLRKYAEEKENMSAPDDWLMTSLSEADLQSNRSSDMQEVASSRGPNCATSPIHIEQGEHDASIQEGVISHCTIQRSASDPLQCEEFNTPVFRSAHSMKDLQEGRMSTNFQTHIHRALADSCKAPALPHKLHLNAQNSDFPRSEVIKDVTPLKPISVNLLSQVVKAGVDSGYNTNSANVSMDVMDLDNGS